MMGRVPIEPHWLAGLPAFAHDDPRVVRASINLLTAAWFSRPAGSLALDPVALARHSHLTAEEVLRYQAILTAGWTVKGDRMTFAPMAAVAERIAGAYHHAIRQLEDSLTVAMQAPDLFGDSLIADDLSPSVTQPAQVTTAATNGTGFSFGSPSPSGFRRATAKRSLPEGAGLSVELSAYLTNTGFAPDQFDDIWSRFEDFARGRGLKAADWAAQFRTWVRNGISYSQLVPKLGTDNPAQRPAAQIALRRSGEAAEHTSIESLRRVREVMSRFGPTTV
ncbi:hypothetical protein K2O51_31880 (plasmid) [Cupriavidus pinatubonensis]|uniref:hypothetical protein n=1 Tax=Cupriavidus pinatubonensis TaxID=248026 RepID=UPI001C737312|nr:hypothetical protein [Cupriavidus pinatubonensis]QYY33627.1 hypothetical protein K2O51_31880 [Cupriavidus pinatubonensis]